MNLDEKFGPVRTAFYNIVGNFFKTIAGFFGYPENTGMPTIFDIPSDRYLRSEFVENLPIHRTYWPPLQYPETWFEMIFGPAPKVETVPRIYYENTEEGFYNFYIENYKNIFFLPDSVSEFIQVRLNICLDISLLETIREVLFVGLMIYCQIVILRIAVSWFIYINPYTWPWFYLVAAVDWTEDVLHGLVPAILGVNMTGSIFLGALGVIADSLNHLIFTMPFLPSEGEESKLLVDQNFRDVLVFHYLPVLWYRYPIPNEIREFWYKERRDILDYMQRAYKDLGIRFLPDNIVLSHQKLTAEITSIQGYISTELLSKDNLIQMDSFLSLNEQFHNLFINHINHVDKFL